jgi:hypothetical protein
LIEALTTCSRVEDEQSLSGASLHAPVLRQQDEARAVDEHLMDAILWVWQNERLLLARARIEPY